MAKRWDRLTYEQLVANGGGGGGGSGSAIQSPITYTDSTTPLAGGATFPGTARPLSATNVSKLQKFAAEVLSNVAGTLNIQKSVDNGVTFNTIVSMAYDPTANAQSIKIDVSGDPTTTQYKLQYVNGATIQTKFVLTSGFYNF